MADFETPTLEIVLEFECNRSAECYFFSKDFFQNYRRDAQLQVIRD